MPPRGTFVDPASLPEVYAMIVDGNCLEPVIPDRTPCVFNRSERPLGGDFAIIFRRPEFCPEGRCGPIIKQLGTAVPDWVTFPWHDHLVPRLVSDPRQRIGFTAMVTLGE